MRTLRLSLVGTVILMLLGSAGGFAQDEDPTPTTDQPTPGPVAWVTGIEHCATTNTGSSTVDDAGVRHFRDGLFIIDANGNRQMDDSDLRIEMGDNREIPSPSANRFAIGGWRG